MSTGQGQNGFQLSKVDQQIANSSQQVLGWQQQLRAAMFDAVNEADVKEIVQKQVERAKQGNESAARFLLQHVLGTQTPITVNQTTVITDVETAAKLTRGERRLPKQD